LPSQIIQLPTGARLQYAIADFKTPKGVLVEGRGVRPDVEVSLTRRALLEGRDSQLEAAIEQIKKVKRNA
jgi:C-terminal processing protease CtpA/Prc